MMSGTRRVVCRLPFSSRSTSFPLGTSSVLELLFLQNYSTRARTTVATLSHQSIYQNRPPSFWRSSPQQKRWLSPAPRPGDGPLLERRADRELPDVQAVSRYWRRTLPVFVLIIVACSAAVFNYQKSSSSVVSSTLYALRTSPTARALLGDEIYFRRQIPWIHGQLNQVQGKIDIRFDVKGSRGEATMRFASYRPTPKGLYRTTEWSLTLPDGRVVDLLQDDGQSGQNAPAMETMQLALSAAGDLDA